MKLLDNEDMDPSELDGGIKDDVDYYIEVGHYSYIRIGLADEVLLILLTLSMVSTICLIFL